MAFGPATPATSAALFPAPLARAAPALAPAAGRGGAVAGCGGTFARVAQLHCAVDAREGAQLELLRPAGTTLAAGAAAVAVGAATTKRPRARRRRLILRAVPVADLLPPGVAETWPELQLPDPDLEAVALDLGDLTRGADIVADVFEIKKPVRGRRPGFQGGGAFGGFMPSDDDDGSEYPSMVKGLSGRLGGGASILAGTTPRPSLLRPAPLGSTARPDQGLVLAFVEKDADFMTPLAVLNDIGLWPADGRVRAPGCRSKPGLASKPYMVNLCTRSSYQRRGLARAMLKLSERIISDIWGDTDIYLHVEDKEVAANALYEATDYSVVKIEQDAEFPLNEDELKIIETVTYRRKELMLESPGSLMDAQSELEARLAEEEAEERRLYEEELLREAEEEDEEDDEEDDEENDEADQDDLPEVGEDEDFSWVSSLKK